MSPGVITTVDIPLRTKGCCQPVAVLVPEAEATELAQVYAALADPTRVRMIGILAEAVAPVCVCDFTASFALTQPTISHHLAKLRDAGLVTSFRRGIWSFHSLDPGMTPAAADAVRMIRASVRPRPASRS